MKDIRCNEEYTGLYLICCLSNVLCKHNGFLPMGICDKYTIELLLVPVSFKKDVFVNLNTFQFIIILLSCAVEL